MTEERTRTPRAGRVASWFRGLPRWLHSVLGVIATVLGAVVIVRPTTSLGLLAILIGAGLLLSGVLELVGRRTGDNDSDSDSDGTPRPSFWRIAGAAVWILAGLLVLLLPGLTVRVLAVIVGLALIVDGVLSVVAAFRPGKTVDARIAAAALGIAEVVFGVLALAWPDVTLIIVAVVFGARLVIFGLLEIWHSIRGTRRRRADADAKPTALRRWAQTTAAVVALVLAVGAASVSAGIHGGSPVVDEFYAAPRTVPDEPGKLIRSEPFTRDIPDNARAWRILYTTTLGDGSPAVASGIVVIPRDADGPFPVIDWTHGTTGFAENCAPSLAEHPFESGALFLTDQIIDHGWALVATDYIGLGTKGPHPYLIGPDTGHAALDAARAARELDGANLGDQNVVWGHSQGGAGALWTGALADAYAPDLDIQGVASLAPASNLPGLVGNLDIIPGGSVFGSYIMSAYSRIYPDVTMRDYVRPGAEAIVRQMAERCLAEPGVFVSLLDVLALSNDPVIFSKDPTTGPMGVRLEENTPPPTISAPLLLGQGAADQLVIPSAQDAYVEGLCGAGQQVDYRLYAGRDHVPLVEPDSPLVPDLFAWTEARLAGEPVDPGCTRVER
ncbi:hypothetical protein ET445_13620 [Agromyces protaetiae]|uniref:Lipase n=1 Tax=Agromyces protaetiae TaxID=2509455 RepID=A0A4P6FUG3_9MICO|nr:DUF308 domain-containing protein [Agromyces protaetiae]QAY74208.1 hypothetical protein ET445_13620 [Agromyces protaetiae]